MLRWISTLGSLGALLACKGLLVFFAVMSAFGVSMTLDGTIWANLILGLVTLAITGFLLNLRRHHNLIPFLVAAVGAGMIYYAYLVEFIRPVETAGIVILVIAAVLEIWWLRKRSTKALADSTKIMST